MPKGKRILPTESVEAKPVEQVVSQVVDNNERGAVAPELSQPAPVVETPAEEFVTLTAADPKVKLEVSINGEIWVGHSITVPKANEADVRRLLEGAGMYVKN